MASQKPPLNRISAIDSSSSKTSRIAIAMEKMRTVCGNLLGTIAVCVGLWMATSDHVAAASACFSAGILILLIANINHFEFIKGFGFEARTKQLDEKLEAADHLLGQLRTTSQLFADISAHLIARIGRWSGPIPKPEVQDLVTRMQVLLNSLEVGKTEVDQCLRPIHAMVLRDLASPLFSAFFTVISEKTRNITEKMQARITEVQFQTGSPILADDPPHNALTKQFTTLQEFIARVQTVRDTANPFELIPILEATIKDAPDVWEPEDRTSFMQSIAAGIAEWKSYANDFQLEKLTTWLSRGYE